jgi:site-specific recombinase XerD
MQQIRETCEAIAKTIKARGFRTETVNKYWRHWNKLLHYMSENKIAVYTPKVGLDFLEDGCGILINTELNREKRWVVRSVQHINDYLEFGTIFLTAPAIPTTSCLARFGNVLEAFKSHQRKKHDISAITLSSYDKHIGKFLLYLENQNLTNLSDITSAQIYDCCKMIAKLSGGVAHNMSCAVRVFLRYLHKEGVLRDDFSKKIPFFPYSRKSKLLSTLDTEEMTALFGAINRASHVGKRDYAIILLACRLGLRSGDIRALQFSQIQWERNIIDIVTHKTGKPLTLPLLAEVGQSIIDYIKYARPVIDSPIIFQTCTAPIEPLSASAVSNIVKRYAGKAAIKTAPGRHFGSHLLRHTLASALLRENVPLPEISGILAHSATRTTQEHYLRIDINQLKRCAIEPPPFSWEPTEEVF